MKRKRPRVPGLTLPGVETGARMVTPIARAGVRARIEAPAPLPWLCVVLAIDTARHSGWCVNVQGRRVDSGELDTLDGLELGQVVRWAVDLAAVAALPVVLVLESPWGGNATVVAALGAAAERWRRAWRDCGQAPGRVVRVQPNQWRGPVLGRQWVSAPRADVRAHELVIAGSVARRSVGDDEAPAILIARWASHAARVGHVIGKRACKASLHDWTQPKEPA